MKYIHLFLVLSLFAQLASSSQITSTGTCKGITKLELETVQKSKQCNHACCKKSSSSCQMDDKATHEDDLNNNKVDDSDQSKSSESDKDGCKCNKKTSSQSLYLSPNQGNIASRSTIHFKNKFTNPKTYHFDLNHSIFHPPRALA